MSGDMSVQLDWTREDICHISNSIYYINLDQLFQKVNIPKAISGHMCSDTTFLSGQNPYNIL